MHHLILTTEKLFQELLIYAGYILYDVYLIVTQSQNYLGTKKKTFSILHITAITNT